MSHEKKERLRKKFYGPLLSYRDQLNLSLFILKNQLSSPKSKGPIQEFEQGFSDYMGGGHSLLTQSGTSGILSSLVALGLKKDDEIIFPSFGFHACIMPAHFLQLKIKWAPVDKDSFLIDTNELKKIVTEKTKAIFVLHLFGQPVDDHPLFELKKKFDFKIFADCSHAFMAEVHGKPVAHYADIAAFSLQQNKFLAVGEGGVIWSKNSDYIDRIKAIAHPGQKLPQNLSPYQDISFGLKFRPHPIVAWLANNQLQKRNLILKAHQESLSAIRKNLESRNLPFHYLPVVSKNTRPAGYCYLKFRLPEDLSEDQVYKFRDSIQQKGTWVKSEHFLLMSKLPKEAPFEFSNYSSLKKSQEDDFQKEIQPLIDRQFAIRLPMSWKATDLQTYYSQDLNLIESTFKSL